MPSNNPSQRAAEISEELEILRTHSANCSDNAAKILLNVIGQFKVFLKALTMLAGGGAEAEQDALFEDKLACEHEKHMARQEMSHGGTRKVLAQRDQNSLFQTMADGARKLIGTGVKP